MGERENAYTHMNTFTHACKRTESQRERGKDVPKISERKQRVKVKCNEDIKLHGKILRN